MSGMGLRRLRLFSLLKGKTIHEQAEYYFKYSIRQSIASVTSGVIGMFLFIVPWVYSLVNNPMERVVGPVEETILASAMAVGLSLLFLSSVMAPPLIFDSRRVIREDDLTNDQRTVARKILLRGIATLAIVTATFAAWLAMIAITV